MRNPSTIWSRPPHRWPRRTRGARRLAPRFPQIAPNVYESPPDADRKFIYVSYLLSGIANIVGPAGISGCFRCAFVWLPRTTNPVRCPRCKSLLWDAPQIRPVRPGKGLGIEQIIKPRREALEDALAKHRARNPRVYGSVARNQAGKRSDLDLLVDFDRDASAFDQMGLIADLEDIFQRKVDVAEPSGVHWLIRPQVLFEAVSV